MPDAPLVGKVAIKVLPDTEDFRKDLKREVEREADGVEAEVDAKVKSDNQIKESLLSAIHRVNSETKGDDRYALKVPVKLDSAGIKRQLRTLVRELKAMTAKDLKLNVDLVVEDIESIRESLSDVTDGVETSVRVAPDMASVAESLAAIKAAAESASPSVKIGANSSGVEDAINSIKDSLGRIPIEPYVKGKELVRLRDGFSKALSRIEVDIDAKKAVANIGKEIVRSPITQWIKIDISNLKSTSMEMERVFYNTRIRFNQNELGRAMRELNRGVSDGLKSIETGRIAKDFTRDIRGEIESAEFTPRFNYRLGKTEWQRLKDFISSDRVQKVINVIPRIGAKIGSFFLSSFRDEERMAKLTKLSNGMFQSLRMLSGQRIHWDYIMPGIEVAKNLDRVSVSTAKIATGVMGIGTAGTWAVGGLLGVANGIGKITAAGLVLPGVLAGIGVSMNILVYSLANFEKEVPTAAKALLEMNEAGNKAFWSKARKSIKEMTDTILPKAIKGYAKVGAALGDMTAKMSGSLKKFVAPELDRFFNSLSQAIKNSGGWATAMGRVAGSFLRIASDYMPKMGAWLGRISTQFANWLDQSVKTGKAHKWIDDAWKNMKLLAGVLKDAYDVMHSLSKAATEAGFGLEGTAKAMEKLDKIVASPGFQKGMVDVFKASRKAMSEITSRVGPEVGKMFSNLVKVFTTSAPLAGEAIGTIGAALAKSFADPRFSDGINDMFKSIRDGAVESAPYLKDVGANLGTLGRILGNTFKDFAPLIARTFDGLTDTFAKLEEPIDRITTALSGALGPVLDEISPLVGDVAVVAFNGLADAAEWLAKKLENLPGKIRKARTEFNEFKKNNEGLVKAVAGTIGKLAIFAAMLSPIIVPLKAMSFLLFPMGRLLGGFAAGLIRASMGGGLLSGAIKALTGGGAGGIGRLVSMVSRPLSGAFFNPISLAALAFGINMKYIYDNSESMRKALAPLTGQFEALGKAIKDTFSQLGSGNIDGFVRGFQDIGRRAGEIVRTSIKGAFTGIFDPGWKAQLLVDFMSAFPQIVEGVRTFFGGIDWVTIITAPMKIGEIGMNVALGFVEGLLGVDINAMSSQIWKGFIDFVKGLFGIHSPSVVFHEIGTNIIQGLINGLTSMGGPLSAAASAIANLVLTKFRELGPKLSEVWGTIKTGASTAWSKISSTVSSAATTAATKAKNGFTTMKAAVSSKLSEMASDSSSKWSKVKSDTSSKVGQLKSDVSSKFSQVKSDVSSKLSQTKSDASSKWSGIKSDTSSKASSMRSDVSSKFESIRSSISSKLASAKSSGSSAISGLKSSVTSNLSSMKSSGSSSAEGLRSAISSKLASARSSASQSASGIKSSVVSQVNSMRSSVSSTVSRVPGIFSRMGSTIRSIVGGISLSGVGRNMVQGLIRGMGSMLDRVRGIARRIAQAAEGAIRKASETHSPSRVWMRLGSYMGEGLAIGIEDQTRLVRNASTSLLDIPSKMELDLPKVNGVNATNSSQVIRAMGSEVAGATPAAGVSVTQQIYTSDPLVAARAASDQLQFALR